MKAFKKEISTYAIIDNYSHGCSNREDSRGGLGLTWRASEITIKTKNGE